MDGVVFRKDGIEFQLNNFEFSFDASGNLIARHTGTGNELVFTTDGGVNVDTVNATTEVTTSAVNATDVTSDTLTASTEVTSPSVTTDALEATDSITDPEGNTVTNLSDPVRVTEEASSFAESDVTVTNNGTTVSSGLISLQNGEGIFVDDFENGIDSGWTGDTANLSTDSTNPLSESQSATLEHSGSNVTVTSPSVGDSTKNAGFKVRVSEVDNYRFDFFNSSGTLIGTLTFFTNIMWEGNEIISNTEAGTIYTVVLDWDFSNDEVTVNINDTSKTYGLANTVSDWDYVQVDNVSDSGDSVTFDNNPTTNSGNSLVEFDNGSPTDIDSWDLATFQRTLDGETVTVDVEDSNGTVLKSDISKDTDISDISTSTDVQLRANLSRSNTANNPTVDYLARRFTR